MSVHYEFGGPLGAIGIIFGLPLVTYALFFLCGADYCLAPSNAAEALDRLVGPLSPPALADLVSARAFAVVFGWFLFQVLLERFLPGPEAQGVVLKNGSRLTYRINGHRALWVSVACVGGLATQVDLSFLCDDFPQLITAALALSFAISFYIYASSFAKGALLADGGDTPSQLYNFFIGRELNPRIGSFDLKEFCELRPGLIGWCVLNLGMAAKQYHELGGTVTPSMVLVNAFQFLYVWDALYYEKAILTTMDITTDGFGFMLCFGDLVWVPFTYSTQARYLATRDAGLSWPVLAGIVALKVLGYAIFRGSNGQKDVFRSDRGSPAVAHLRTIKTSTGRELIVSGWWGLARKINYTGDWCMGLAWCSLCGTGHIIPYFYSIYFLVLLIHRAMRDNEACEAKYGADWAKYKKAVPYVFVPGII